MAKAGEVVGQGQGSRIPPARFLVQAFQADGFHVARRARLQEARRRRLLRPHLFERLQDGGGREGRPARQQFVENRPQGVNVGGGADLAGVSEGLLRGHIAGRAQDRPPARLTGIDVELFGQAEVADLGDSHGTLRTLRTHRSYGKQHIGRLEIAMDDAGAVRRGDGVRQLLDQAGGRFRRQRGAVEVVRQRAAVAVFQHQIRTAVVDAVLEHLDDVRMLQAGNGLGLVPEALSLVAGRRFLRADHLQGDKAVERRLPRLVHHAHAAAAQLGQDLVFADLAGQGRTGAISAGTPNGCGFLLPPRRFRARTEGMIAGPLAEGADRLHALGGIFLVGLVLVVGALESCQEIVGAGERIEAGGAGRALREVRGETRQVVVAHLAQQETPRSSVDGWQGSVRCMAGPCEAADNQPPMLQLRRRPLSYTKSATGAKKRVPHQVCR